MIQKVHPSSRNEKRLKNQSKRGENTSKDLNKLTIMSKRRSSDVDFYSKKMVNSSLNKLPKIKINNSFYNNIGINKTYNGSVGISLNNISISKIKRKEKNRFKISNNTKNVLL